MDFDPNLLRTFAAVHELGGFTRAARRMHLTQSAVSHQIRRLEEQVGRPLFLRTTRKLALTQDGADFLHYARSILQSLDALNARFRSPTISGVLRVGVPENFMGRRLPQLLAQFAQAFPTVRLEVTAGVTLDLREMLAEDAIDLAIVLSMRDARDGVVVRTVQFHWVVSQNFTLPVGALLPLALAPPPCICRQVGLAALDGRSVNWNLVFTSHSQKDIRAAVLGGFVVGVLTDDDLEPGMLIVDGEYGLPLLPAADFLLIRGQNGATPAADAFAHLVLEMVETE